MIKPLISSTFLFLAILFSATQSFAQENIERYGRLPSISMMAISPDATRVAYRKTTDNLDAVLVYSIKDGKRLGGVALNEEINPSSIYFLDDNLLVLQVYHHTRMRGFRGKHNVSNAFLYDIKKDKTKPMLTKNPPIHPGQTGLGRILGISKDKKYVYMPAYSGYASTENPSYTLFRVKISNNKLVKSHFAGKNDSLDFFLGPDDKALVHEIYNNRNNLHQVLVKQEKDWKEIYHLETEIREIDLLGLTPDYKNLIIHASNESTGRWDYFTMSLADGSINNSAFSRADTDAEAVLTDINRVVHGVRYAGFNPTYRFYNDQINKEFDRIQEVFAGNSVWISDWAPDWKTLLVAVEGSNFSGQYYSVERGKTPVLLASSRPDIPSEAIHPIAKVNLKASDGLVIPTLLTIPKTHLSNMKNLPTVMLPHGGPRSYDVIEFDWLAQSFAEQGYLVRLPQFRGSEGFGVDHYTAGRGEWGGKMQTDLSDTLKTLADKGYVDPNRVCIVGWSYGGYAALAGGAFTPDLYKCVVSIAGVADINKMIAHKKYRYGHDHWVISYFDRNIGGGKMDKKQIQSISPAFFAKSFKAPVLLLHGDIDKVVPIDQSKLMHRALKKAKKDVKFVELEGDNHSVVEGKTRMRLLKEVIAFLNQHLG